MKRPEARGQGSIDSLAFLSRAFADLDGEGRLALLNVAVEELVKRRLPRGATEDSRDDLLRLIADETFPSDEAAGLRSHARGAEPSADEGFFPDGLARSVLESAVLEHEAGLHYLRIYASIRDSNDSMGMMPEPSACLGVTVPESDCMEYDDDQGEWALNMVAYEAAVEQRCAAIVERMFAVWRHRFFAALIR